MSEPSQFEEPNESCHEHDQDFSVAWEQSDLILLVEEKQLHVHRAILATSSLVFSRMFDGNFKEKNAKEIPLPGKDYDEIKEMLLVIYPNSWKPVDESNYIFLLALAQEYQMTKLTEKCEDYLIDALTGKNASFVLEALVLAQEYALERVVDKCIVKTESLTIREIKRHPLYDQIEPVSQRKMIELLLHNAEKEIERLQRVAGQALSEWEMIVTSLGQHIFDANSDECQRHPLGRRLSRDDYLETIQHDRWVLKRRKGICEPLYKTGSQLENLRDKLKEISYQKPKILLSTQKR